MSELKGYAGKIAYIDLTEQKVRVEELPEETARKYLGGKGLGAYLLYRHLRPGIDPYDPDNVLIFISGPLTGTAFPCSGRCAVVTKSPMTNEASTRGPSTGQVVDRKAFEKMLDEYYEIVGWDVVTGVPTEKRLRELGIEG